MFIHLQGLFLEHSDLFLGLRRHIDSYYIHLDSENNEVKQGYFLDLSL